MTRPSKREIERRFEDLLEGTDTVADDRHLAVFEDPETGEWYDDPALDGEPIEKTDADPMAVFCEEVVETEWTPDATGVGGVES
jgi:hypothetical protein